MGGIEIKPIVDEKKCSGSGTCISVCPQGVFEIKNGKSKVIYPEKCIGCYACETACPKDAIKLVE